MESLIHLVLKLDAIFESVASMSERLYCTWFPPTGLWFSDGFDTGASFFSILFRETVCIRRFERMRHGRRKGTY